MTTRLSKNTCFECIHMRYSERDRKICDAFPHGIPWEIYNNAYFHSEILPEQKGTVIFEMKPSFKEMYNKVAEMKKKIRESKLVKKEREGVKYNEISTKINQEKVDLRIFKSFNTENIDTFCSVLGKEFLFELDDKSFVLIPCYNVGYYDNEVNPESITKSIDYSFCLFEDIYKVLTYLGLYKDSKRTEFFEKRIHYNFINEEIIEEGHVNFYLEGFCYRMPSFTYATYNIFSKKMHLIIINNKELKEYKSRIEEFDSNENIKDFLVLKHIDEQFLRNIIENIK